MDCSFPKKVRYVYPPFPKGERGNYNYPESGVVMAKKENEEAVPED